MTKAIQVTHSEAESLYEVITAMQSNICPKCCRIQEAMLAYGPEPQAAQERHAKHWGIECPSCGFAISGQEMRDGLAAYGKYLAEDVKTFEAWRELRRGIKPNER